MDIANKILQFYILCIILLYTDIFEIVDGMFNMLFNRL